MSTQIMTAKSETIVAAQIKMSNKEHETEEEICVK